MAMANEIREAIDDADDMDDSSSEDDDGDEQDHDEDAGDDVEDARDDEEEDTNDIQAGLTAVLQNGQIEMVDDLTGQLVNDPLDLPGEPDEGGILQAGWGDEGGLPDDEGDMEGGDVPEGDDYDDEENDGDIEQMQPPGEPHLFEDTHFF